MNGFSRRGVLRATAVAGGGAVAALPAATAAAHGRRRGRLALVGGRIHTMDARGSVAAEVLIEDGRFVDVGRRVDTRDARVVNLRGRTVVPGLIEGHVHFVSLANRPGWHVVIENARDIARVERMLADGRAGRGTGFVAGTPVPEGQFITAMGGWHPNLFAERRLPTLAELDAAVPDRPVLLFQGGTGPCATNSPGKAFLETVSDALAGPVVVGDDGSIASGAQSRAALYHLRARQTFEDRKRSALDAMTYSGSLGLTALLDQVLPPSPGPINPSQGLPNLDHFRMYDPLLALHREGRTFVRLQTNFLHNETDPALPELRDRLNNQFPLFGDDLMMTGAIGEWGAAGDGTGAAWTEAQRLIARARWRNTNRTLTLAALEAQVAGYEAVHAEFGIAGLRWTIHHVQVATDALLTRLKAMDVGVQTGTWRYVSGTPTAAGSPFRLVVDNGIKAGIHMDGVHIAPLTPWLSLYYAVTGVNALGVLINDGQQLTRQEAMRLYTRENAWHLNMEDRIGSIEKGKLADLVVLDRDYFTVPDEELKLVSPVLTLVGGEVVHDSGAVRVP
ncbi:amidohydrolase [Virgisporangium ochraceum]